MVVAAITRLKCRPVPRLTVVADQAAAPLDQISSLLHEAGETHHRVFRIVDGADDD